MSPGDRLQFLETTAALKEWLRENFPGTEIADPYKHGAPPVYWMFQVVAKPSGTVLHNLSVRFERLVDAGLPPIGDELDDKEIAPRLREAGREVVLLR